MLTPSMLSQQQWSYVPAGVYDFALGQEQISQLYSTVPVRDATPANEVGVPASIKSPASLCACAAMQSQQDTKAACSHRLMRMYRCVLQTCQLPLRYNGRDVATCMSWQGRSGCWAQAGKWIPCGPDAGATGPAANVTGVGHVSRIVWWSWPTGCRWCRMAQSMYPFRHGPQEGNGCNFCDEWARVL